MPGISSVDSCCVCKFYLISGFCRYFQGIQMCTKKALCNIKGISEAKVEKIKEASAKVSGVCVKNMSG